MIDSEQSQTAHPLNDGGGKGEADIGENSRFLNGLFLCYERTNRARMRVSATRAGSGRDPAPGLHEALGFLTQARKAIGDEYGSDDHLVHAALHLIDCTTDACALLADTDDLEAAREALAAARAAVVAATCAVRHVHDGLRSRTS